MNRRKFLRYSGLGGFVAVLSHHSLFAGMLKAGKGVNFAQSVHLKQNPNTAVTRSNRVW